MVNDRFVFSGQVEQKSASGRRLQSKESDKAAQLIATGLGKMYGNWGYYSGEIEDGQINGYGRMIYPDGAMYDGKWIKGKLNGVGRWMMPNKTEVIGNWKDGTLILSIKYDKMEGFTPPEVRPLPKVSRPMSALELGL